MTRRNRLELVYALWVVAAIAIAAVAAALGAPGWAVSTILFVLLGGLLFFYASTA